MRFTFYTNYMRLHRFFGQFDFGKDRITISDPELFRQWRDVLRFEIGSELMLCDGHMNDALARIISFGRSSAVVEILGVSKNEHEPEKNATLYLSILKGEHFELVAEKATELGIKKIVPIICDRTVKQNIRRERLQKIIKEAAEQSGRGIVPELGEPLEFLSATRQAGAHGANYFFDSQGEDIKSHESRVMGQENATVGIFIGPEGGWTEAEILLAKKTKFKIVSLGPLTLRAETAAIVAVYSVMQVL